MDIVVIQLIAFSLTIGFLIALFLLHREHHRRKALEKFSGILDISKKITELNVELRNIHDDIQVVRNTYQEKRALLHKLEREVSIFDEKLSFAELGVYEPHFDFGDSETFKNKIRECRDRQKSLVKSKCAVTCSIDWTVDGSSAKGRTMTGRQIRLTLRAFNNECEAAIANARWNNANAMEKRILNATTQIDKLNASSQVFIDETYLNLKLEELFLTHEYRETRKRERDERAEAARLAREEQKLIREAEAAEEDEEKYRQMLTKARSEVTSVEGQDLERLKSKIAMLEADLAHASALSKRARSMAEMTRSGFVYIVSNIGSFGDGVVKIGLTRRLDPEDRVRELSGASVPFVFDTHAMIYSEDAPTLESALHTEFFDRRINAANLRKEFFRVALDEVEAAVYRLAPQATFFRDREAQDYYETLARRHQQAERLRIESENALPESI